MKAFEYKYEINHTVFEEWLARSIAEAKLRPVEHPQGKLSIESSEISYTDEENEDE
jgi:hypothetical protein